MTPARYMRELTRRPLWRIEHDRLVMDVSSKSFVVHRDVTETSCNIKFAPVIRMNRATPVLLVTPTEVYVAPNITVHLAPTGIEYDPRIRFTESFDLAVDDLDLDVRASNVMATRAYGAKVSLPDATRSYDIYGVEAGKVQPRCLRRKMVVDKQVTVGPISYDDRAKPGTSRFDASERTPYESPQSRLVLTPRGVSSTADSRSIAQVAKAKVTLANEPTKKPLNTFEVKATPKELADIVAADTTNHLKLASMKLAKEFMDSSAMVPFDNVRGCTRKDCAQGGKGSCELHRE